MTAFLLRPGNLASPSMILLSVGFHALIVCGILLTYSHMTSPRQPVSKVLTTVRLVARPDSEPNLHKMQPVPVHPGPVAKPREVRQEKVAPLKDRSRRRTVKSETLRVPTNHRIRLGQHKAPQRVAKPKPKKQKEPRSKTAQEAKNPERIIAERIKRIRERIKGGQAGHSQSAETSRELTHWLELVRERLNNHWSVFRDDWSPGKLTRISVDIADDGTLRRASIRQSSGDQVFDRSAMRAAYRAAPYPVVPAAVREQIRAQGGLVLRFTPGGIR